MNIKTNGHTATLTISTQAEAEADVMRYVVNFSGGIGSWASAKRIAERHGTDRMTLLFADTLIEDEDLYRFLEDAAENIGVPITRIADGRTPWEVFRDVRYLGNTRADPCSRILKRDLLDAWRTNNCDPVETIMVIGIDWSESHRLKRLQQRLPDWKVIAPMCEKPMLTKRGMLRWAEREGLQVPRLYKMGFPHNNCGGACIKAGQSQFLHLLKMMPERYAEWERHEQEMREFLGRTDIAILRDRQGGTTKPLTLRQLRERRNEAVSDSGEWGGCGCAF